MAIHFNIFGDRVHDCGYGDWIYYTINQDGTFLLHDIKPTFKDGKWSTPINTETEFGTGYLWGNSTVPIPDNFDSSKAIFKLSEKTLVLTKDNYLSLSDIP